MRPKLKVVRANDTGQHSLPLQDPSWLVFYAMEESGAGAHLTRVLETVRPKIVFDVRALPRFDYAGLDRQVVFKTFDAFRVRYYDIGALCRIPPDLTKSLDSILRVVGELLTSSRETPSGPVMFLLETPLKAAARLEIPAKIPAPKGGWHLRSV